jgi:GDP-4-dehydro-6-deoxy-D-mannose reductase
VERIWVTGAAGFVGRRLCARLADRGSEVAPSDRELDLCDAGAVAATARAVRPTAVVHLAAISVVPEASADPWRAFRVNVLGTRNLLAAVSDAAPRARVLVVGTSLVYGSLARGATSCDERAPLAPEGAYARTKAAADLLAAAVGARGLDVVRARPCNHTGGGRPESFVESSLARRVIEIERGVRPARLEVANPGSIRDFTHVEDVIDAYLALLEPGIPAGAYNVASDTPISIGALAERLATLAGVATEIVGIDDPSRAPDANLASARKLRAATAWRPTRSLDTALQELLADWRSRLNATP